jgi:hypothetical protein
MELCDERSIERHLRQLLCDKISGNLVGMWLLIAEHLRLGTWNLLRRWTGKDSGSVEPRVALQLVHESALCITGKRQSQTLSQQGFEVANGLPFVASSSAVHGLLDSHTVAEAQTTQLMLGKLRQALGHYPGKILAIDPHRIPSHSKRQMVRRKKDPQALATKQVQTFFALDADSQQPICFTLGSSSRTVSQATPELLDLTAKILNLKTDTPLVLADTEHYTLDLLEHVRTQLPFDLLVPMPQRKKMIKELRALPPEAFKRQWIGYATTKRSFRPKDTHYGPYWQTIQRCGECDSDYKLKAFLCTSQYSSVDEPVQYYPERWHCEEFFNANQALGWHRAGTLNLNIRYGHMTMALIAQASIHMLRKRLGKPINKWDAKHLARDFFHGLEGDVRVYKDTIIVTYYNAPNVELLRKSYTDLPEKLEKEGVDPRVPWLYNYKLDFRFN